MAFFPVHRAAPRLWHARRRDVQKPRPRRVVAAVLAVLWLAIPSLAGSAGALAQTSGAGEADVRALERMVETLESPERRARFLADLKAALAAERATQAAAPAEGASVLRAFSDGLAAAGGQIVLLARQVADAPDAARWLAERWAAPGGRDAWLIGLGKLLAVVAGGIAAGLLAYRGLRKPRRLVERMERPSRWLGPPLLLGYHLLRLAPHLVMVGVGYGALAVIGPSEPVRLIAVSILNAHLVASIVKMMGAQALAPHTPQFRLTAFTDETAFYCAIWWRRLVNITVYGYFFCQAALLLGLPGSGYAALVHLLGLLVVGLLVVLILQNRAPFARWMRAASRAGGSRSGARLFAFLGRLADFWHIPAILYVVAGGLLSAARGLEGFVFLAKSTAATIAIAWAAGFAVVAIRRAFARGFRVRAELSARYPGLQARVERYLPAARAALQAVVLLFAACLVLEAWDADAFAWLASAAGRAVIGTLAALAAIVVIAMLVLEITASLIDRYLSAVDDEGRPVERSQRARTLLPLARNALRVVVGVVAALMILSEVGIDIAPILAGVGVVGLAVGFGAQTLVKDIITGLFILLEDSVAVGDFVTAGGHSGTVEAITIRTIRLRDLGGKVHTVPFSAVDSVTNETKGFSRYVIDAGVAYREDYDEVAAVMRAVGDDLQRDPEFGPNLLEPLEIMGLDAFGDSAVVVRARLKTLPGRQWATGREYNRRLKAAFDARGIEIPFPHTTIYFGEDKRGEAPAARLALARRAPPRPAP